MLSARPNAHYSCTRQFEEEKNAYFLLYIGIGQITDYKQTQQSNNRLKLLIYCPVPDLSSPRGSWAFDK